MGVIGKFLLGLILIVGAPLWLILVLAVCIFKTGDGFYEAIQEEREIIRAKRKKEKTLQA